MRAVVRIAEKDGISVNEVVSRGVDDLAVRIAYELVCIEERNSHGNGLNFDCS